MVNNMSENININLKSIAGFENLSDSAIKDIEKEAEFLKFSIGYPLSKKEIIPNKIK